MVFAETIKNQMVPPCVEKRGEMDNWVTTLFGHCPHMAFLPVRPHCVNARRSRCQDLNSCPLGELEETTRMRSYYVEVDYSARPEIQKFLRKRSNHCGSESSTLETDVTTHY